MYNRSDCAKSISKHSSSSAIHRQRRDRYDAGVKKSLNKRTKYQDDYFDSEGSNLVNSVAEADDDNEDDDDVDDDDDDNYDDDNESKKATERSNIHNG